MNRIFDSATMGSVAWTTSAGILLAVTSSASVASPSMAPFVMPSNFGVGQGDAYQFRLANKVSPGLAMAALTLQEDQLVTEPAWVSTSGQVLEVAPMPFVFADDESAELEEFSLPPIAWQGATGQVVEVGPMPFTLAWNEDEVG